MYVQKYFLALAGDGGIAHPRHRYATGHKYNLVTTERGSFMPVVYKVRAHSPGCNSRAEIAYTIFDT